VLAQPCAGLRHLLFAFCDHHEPLWGGAGLDQGRARVRTWVEGYPTLANEFHDADGRPPRHSFFFPGDQYRPELVDDLGPLVRMGLGEIEVHLHHDGDTRESLRDQLVQTVENLARHGHLSRDSQGRPRYGFIHGNWALANGRRDGRWCGVNDELPLLHETGCYADFTFPAAPDAVQPAVVNQIYWPVGNLARARAFDRPERARVGRWCDDRILLIQGPLTLSLRPARGRLPVRIENAALTANDPATRGRVREWVAQNIHVSGRPEWVFVKVHTHGSPEAQAASLLGEGGRALHIALNDFNDGRRWALHYLTAREMYNVAVAAMDGRSGDPNDFRDYRLPAPSAAS
jgi:hypothetical protein